MRLLSSSASALRWVILTALAIVTPIIFTGCGASAFSNPPTTKVPLADPMATADSVQSTTTVAPILLFNGTGTSSSDVAAWETILTGLKLSYSTVNSSQMNSMSETTLKSHKLLLVPGGNSATIGKYLTKTTTTNIHNAVQGGLHYLGVCAGAFFGGYSIYNGLNLTSGVWYNPYSTSKLVMDVSFPNGTVYDIYFQDGPELAGWGATVGKYPDGKPAIVEGYSGTGWVILSGVHPEAPSDWEGGMNFTTSVSTDHAYAAKLVTYALNGSSLPHF